MRTIKLISVIDIVGRSLSSRKDGKKLRLKICQHWETVDTIKLDFHNMEVASVSFIDEAFGALVDDHSLEELKDKLSFLNLEEAYSKLLNYIILSREKEKNMSYSHKED